MTYLVLGSSGLVGKSFCDYIVKNNKEVILWDLKLGTEFDLRDTDNLGRLEIDVIRSDYILFAAYDIGGAKFLHNKNIDTLSNNFKIILNVFSVLAKHTSKKFIFLSSQMSNLIDNEYGVSKRVGEFYCNYYNGINVRLWNIYGYEEQSIKSHAIPDFINMALETTVIKLRTNGEEMRQFIYETDCAEALFVIFEHYEEFKGHFVDVSSGNWITIKDVAMIVKKNIADTSILKCMERDEIQQLREPNLVLRKYWQPKISLEEGIQMIIKKSVDLHS